MKKLNLEDYERKAAISVCIPAKNAQSWLAEAIESIKAQTFEDWEIIVINDASTDHTQEIIDYYMSVLPPYRFKTALLVEEDEKTTNNIACVRNIANSYAMGDVICVQDADDVSPKDRLKKTWKYFKRHKDVDLIYGAIQYIDSFGKPFGQEPAQPFDVERLKNHNYIPHPSVAYRKKAIKEVPYRETCKVVDDWFLYYDFIRAGKKIAKLDDVLAYYRILPSSVSRARVKEVDEMKAKFIKEANEDPVPVGN